MCFINPSLNTHVNKNQRNWGKNVSKLIKLQIVVTNYLSISIFFLQMLTLYRAQEPLKVEGN